MKTVQITQQGLDTLKKELDALVNIKRPKVVDRLSYARSQGDLSENSDYSSAKEELEFIDGRIAELQDVISQARIVNDNGNSTDGVSVGTRVTVKTSDNKHTFHIVGEWEADPVNKKISFTSPLGQALVGKNVGDKVEVEAPVGRVVYEILAIE